MVEGERKQNTVVSLFDSVFWVKIWKALQKILGALILGSFHFLLDFLFKHAFQQYPLVSKAVSIMLLVAFLIIYFILILGMVWIFLPERKPREKRGKRVAKGN